MTTRHRVLLLRPWDVARDGAGCCTGATGSLCLEGWHEDPEVTLNRERRQHLGAVYRTVRAGLPDDVAVEIVDPHNTLFLLPAVLSDARRHGHPWRTAIREAVRGPAYSAIIVDGRVVSQGELPVPDQALRLVRDALGC